MKDIVIGDHEFVGDWLPFYSEVADVIWGFRTNWKIFYERLNSIVAVKAKADNCS